MANNSLGGGIERCANFTINESLRTVAVPLVTCNQAVLSVADKVFSQLHPALQVAVEGKCPTSLAI